MIALAVATAVGAGVAVPVSAALGASAPRSLESTVEFTGVGYGNTQAQAERNGFNAALNHAHAAGSCQRFVVTP
jgi:hypothetical protein